MTPPNKSVAVYPKLIAFTGLAGHGKSTAAEFFRKELGYVEESFAKAGKLGVQKMFNLPDSSVFGNKEQKEKTIPSLSKKKPISGRFLMQTMMTEWARDIVDPDIWIYAVAAKWDMMKTIPGFRGMVISDLRFDNEAEWVLKQGGIVIGVYTGKHHVPLEAQSHASESGINPDHISMVVYNKMQGAGEFHHALVDALESYLFVKSPGGTPVQTEIDVKPIPLQSIRDLIVSWADKVHPNRTIMNAIQKMVYEEIPEYLLAQDDPLELADIGILLYDIANLAGIDLESAIRDKMEINIKRDWKISEKTGLMSHVEPEPYTITIINNNDPSDSKRVSSFTVGGPGELRSIPATRI